ncbi:MAG: sugar kinase [Rectinema sp.]
MDKTYVVTFGEIMLRLKSPAHERLFQSPTLEATFGGGEANVAASLALFGLDARFVSALPPGPIGDAALRPLRSFGVDVGHVHRAGNRCGIYFLETGADMRASQVVYDRAESSASTMKPGDFPWSAIFADARWFHVTGITPALSESAANTVLEAAKSARAAGVTVSVDLNYRKKLWNYGIPAKEIMGRLVAEADVLIANEEDIQLGLGITVGGIDPSAGKVGPEAYRSLTAAVRMKYPNLSAVAVTLRESHSADRNGWSAVLDSGGEYLVSKKYILEDIVDRVGGGDSFAAGLIFGMLEFGTPRKALEYAVAASALKHTIPGDMNLAHRQEVEQLLAGDGSGRVSR